MALGVDVGGTKILVYDDESGEVRKFQTPKKGVVEFLKDIIQGSQAGLALPCYLRKSVCVKSPHIPELNGLDIKRIFPEVYVTNDANAMAYGEYILRNGKYDPLLLVSLGTGVGGGLVYRGEIYEGRGTAMEIGHLKIFSREKCKCGLAGCLETAIGGAYKEVEEMYNLARMGHRKGIEFFREYGRILARGLSAAIQILDPEIVVIGGSGAHAFPFFKDSLMKELRNLVSFDMLHGIILEPWIAEHSAALGVASLSHKDHVPGLTP